jgi:site-specific recombinase XerD
MGKTGNVRNERIGDLIQLLFAHLTELGYSKDSLRTNKSILGRLERYAAAQGIDEFSIELGREFVLNEFGHILGEKDCSHNVNRAIHMLADFQKYGMIFKQSSLTIKGFSDDYKPLFEDFLGHLRKQGLADSSIATWRGRLFRLEYYLLNCRIRRFEQIELPHVNEYVESLAGFSAGTISATMGFLRRLFDFAHENGYHSVSYSGAISSVRRVNRYRLPNIFTPESVAQILSAANREHPIGKRNFAILMLVARTGLRIGDARELKFSSIDWQNKTLSIVQGKTGEPLTLPLFDDVGWAIIDYLKHGRPITDCEHVFVRHQAPYSKLNDALRQVIVKLVQAAGIRVEARKPIGMHTFRHSIATSMLTSGASIINIAQVLGHSEPESTQRYISVSIDMLRECALEVMP